MINQNEIAQYKNQEENKEIYSNRITLIQIYNSFQLKFNKQASNRALITQVNENSQNDQKYIDNTSEKYSMQKNVAKSFEYSGSTLQQKLEQSQNQLLENKRIQEIFQMKKSESQKNKKYQQMKIFQPISFHLL
ncbi:hypothetical protein ABPG72_014458 [Tetrahymena utriculariae]